MPPKVRITKEQIIKAALELVRLEGAEALNARLLAKKLECSTQPIFCNYTSMQDLRADALYHAYTFYFDRMHENMRQGKYPPYKASGMSYIFFAAQEPQLFKWLFMRDRAGEMRKDHFEGMEDIIDLVMKNMGITKERAEKFHFEMWMCVHGIAASVATGFLDFDEESVSDMLTDMYFGLKTRYTTEERK